MKNIIWGILVCGLIAACSNNGANYGAAVDDKLAISIEDAVKKFKANGDKAATVKGDVTAVCQSEGCWYNYKTSLGDVKVDFDEKFTIPKDLIGKQAIASGYFYYDTTSIEQLKEWAKDDKKTEEEIEKITAPEINLQFHADGVKIAK